ncbi:MAG: ATP-binding protein [Betaproteobacteria bacterium]
MSAKPATLYVMCGKMAAGKSTFSRALAQKHDAILIVQDDLLGELYPDEILTITDFARCSVRLRNAMLPHIQQLLRSGVSVVLDFPGNTLMQRQWFRQIIDNAGVEHEMHFIDTTDDLCKRQLKQRSAHLPAGSAWTSDAEFDAITAYFKAPAEDEKFNVIRHVRG